MKFDIIGDIHGRFQTLERLLKKLGYAPDAGVWKHEERRVLFLGDYIDRGSQPRETLHLVRGMVDAGQAVAIMGDHELNAVAYNTLDSSGNPLREHTDHNKQQHAATLSAFSGHASEWAGWLDWFKGLPLFYEVPGLRAVHACWCERSVERVRHRSLRDMDFLLEATEKETEAWEAVETLLKGPEINVARYGLTVHAPGDRRREEMRVRWWGYDAPSYALPKISMPPGALETEQRLEHAEIRHLPNLSPGGPPVFFGHYKMPHHRGFAPVDQGICCLDYGAGSGGALVAYRWDGEQEPEACRFVAEPDHDGGI
jgi:hypothetical protein